MSYQKTGCRIIDRQNGKKIRGGKMHHLVDTQGLPMQAVVHAADIQDCGGA
ncbi:hypothetical protein J3R73_004832 [Labrys monachus]|uniref:Transposase n=1 Tax=Labrys monachus TaxID=217067 RepID=A0ABU0FLV4_9HYPH|nr:hypothetical protein [Labrys monachus]